MLNFLTVFSRSDWGICTTSLWVCSALWQPWPTPTSMCLTVGPFEMHVWQRGRGTVNQNWKFHFEISAKSSHPKNKRIVRFITCCHKRLGVTGNSNPGLFNPKIQPQTFQSWTPQTQTPMGLKSSWLKGLGLKSLGLRCPARDFTVKCSNSTFKQMWRFTHFCYGTCK